MMGFDDELSIEQAGTLLGTAGLRKTHARIKVLQYLARQSVPVAHAEIAEQLASMGIDASTVFRGLSSLADSGLVARLDLGDRIWRFELREEPSLLEEMKPQHPHVVCRVCGRIECLELRDHRAEYQSLKDWRIEEVLFKGTCHDCASRISADDQDAER